MACAHTSGAYICIYVCASNNMHALELQVRRQ